ncbi:MAG: hypothetical protein JSR82_16745 [Verrucomicrobia bacterium]|nr:hypothetical protein [Verrucomicrobiota bacterium]
MSSLRDYQEHLREKEEPPLVPGPARFGGLVLCALALALAEHWIRRQFPWPVLPFDQALFAGLAAGWLLVAGLIALGVHRARRMRTQLLWLGCGLLALAAEWGVAEWDWRPAERLRGAIARVRFEEADAQTMVTLEARKGAEDRLDRQLAALRDSVVEASGQSAATLRGWVQVKMATRPAERSRAESLMELATVASRATGPEAMFEQRERIASAVEKLSKACHALMEEAEQRPDRIHQAMLDAGVWEWRANRLKEELRRDEIRFGWRRIYQLEARRAECYQEILKVLGQVQPRWKLEERIAIPPAQARDIMSWLAAIEVVNVEHSRLLAELQKPPTEARAR